MRKTKQPFEAAFSSFTACGIGFPDARFHDMAVVVAQILVQTCTGCQRLSWKWRNCGRKG